MNKQYTYIYIYIYTPHLELEKGFNFISIKKKKNLFCCVLMCSICKLPKLSPECSVSSVGSCFAIFQTRTDLLLS